MPKIKTICLNAQKGAKFQVDSAICIENMGFKDDYHAKKDSDRQVSILLEEHFIYMKKRVPSIDYGAFGENLIISGLNFQDIKIGDKISVGNDVILEITIIGKKCPKPCIIYKTVGECIMPIYGIFCKVLKGGEIKNDDTCTYGKR
ncbi:MAG TPA: MOSC domain-containing protein [Spirochaetota bacterium]|jgi:MOSC domain-containing protein YiiM|nr:MAG: MOSC domain protein [Spirochaetes bacterium ADurb.Bin133]HNZ25861.1 MOSC domain-containing protein [Spirochaetota bacterium]HOF00593.1 MOSC domain-containing protein [Spirochaetota bacterium]HOS32065.1 MOSC domain-containing protein [Spirochaetota bacterium]HOS55406.1 MOSC domain-containing protein [Spirochaetota bacterium]